jgi:mRNA interferase RelE/StbE
MSYSLHIIRRAQKELAQLPDGPYTQVRDSIRTLADNPRPHGCQKLTAREGWRVRVGNYRVIYDIDDKRKTVTVLHVGHRRDVYR